MKINNLNLHNFRNHKKSIFEFGDDITLIEGPNGSGKTNILEAVYVLSTGKSPRAKYDRDLIEYDAPFTTVKANVEVENEVLDLEMQIIKSETFSNASSKRAKINKVPKSISFFCGKFNSVLFTPEDIQLITGSPSERRRYMDSVLIQTDKKYKKVHALYTKALKQRNRLLEMIRDENKGHDQIEYWTAQLLENGTYIQRSRKHALEKIEVELIKNGTIISNYQNLELKYKKSNLSEERLEQLRQNEIYAGTSLVGPHRDDFEILFNERNIGEFGSRGEQRSIILSLKLAEIDFIDSENNERPVLLLDDIFSELDEKHKRSVLDIVTNQQTLVTSAEKIFEGKVKNVIKIDQAARE